MIIPPLFTVTVRDIYTGEPINGIAVAVRFSYEGTKNPFIFIPQNSNNDGRITFTDNYAKREMERTSNIFLMDYSYPKDHIVPRIQFDVLSTAQIKHAVEFMSLFKNEYSDAEVEELLCAGNGSYEPLSMDIPYDGTGDVDFEVLL